MAENKFVSYEQLAFEFFLKEVDSHFHHVVEKLLGWDKPQEVQFRTGSSSVVIKFRVGDEFYIFRVPKFGRFQVRIYLVAHQHFSDSGLMPEKIYHDERCILERFIDGKSPKGEQIEDEEIKKMGSAFRLLHRFPSAGFDCVMHGKEGTKKNLSDCFSTYVREGMEWLEQNHIMDDERLEHLKKIMAVMPEPADDQPCLCHGDLSSGNIIITEGGVTLIDWDCLSSFPREYDFSFLNVEQDFFSRMDRLIEYYGMPLNKNLINYFSFCNILRMISTAGDPFWEMWRFCDVFDRLLLQM
jgi:thiamine kinase-like enzyme